MKRALSFILVIILALSFTACNKGDDAPAGMKLASNKDIVDYSMYVPEGWIVDQSSATTAAHISDSDRTSVNVAQWNYQGSIDDWWSLEYKPQVMEKGPFTDCKIIKEGESYILGGAGAKLYEYTAKLGDTYFKYTVIACVTRGSIYVLHVTYMQDNVAEGQEITYSLYERNSAQIKLVLDSFKFN